MLKEYGALLAKDADWAARAEAFRSKVRDVSEFLCQIPLRKPAKRIEGKVTYHDPCHLRRGQQVWKEPRKLLSMIDGLELVELPEADWCCGSAGTYNLTQPEMARRLQERKIANIRAAGAEAVVTANPGCIIQIAQGLRAPSQSGHTRAIEVLHIVELLDAAYRGERA